MISKWKEHQYQSKQMGLGLTTYNITFKWILEDQNEATDSLSRLVKLPHDRQAKVQMLTATDHDGPAFNTRSSTTKCNVKEDLTSQPKADTVTPDVTIVTDMPDVMLKPLTEDRLHTLPQMQRTTHSVSISPNICQMERSQNMRLTFFYMLKDYSISMPWIQTRSS